MPSTNRFVARFVMAASVVIGGGSLLLFGIFLVVGAFIPFRFHASQSQILLWDGFLSLLFFVQHSGVVRRSSKKRLKRIIPEHYHPAAYSIASGIALAAVVILWQPAETVIYNAEGLLRAPFIAVAILAVFGFYQGVRALGSFDTFGLDPIRVYIRGTTPEPGDFKVRGPYLWVRHPLYFFMLVLIWSASRMTLDRLLFDVTWTLWVILGTYLEERDLVADFGETYRRYQKTVPMLIPWRGRVSSDWWAGSNE